MSIGVAQRSQKTWAELFACSQKAFEEEVVGVRFKELLDFVIKVLENFLEATQLTDETFCYQHERPILPSEPAFRSLKPSPEQLSQTRKAKLEIGLIICVQFGEQALRFRILARSLLVFLQSLLL